MTAPTHKLVVWTTFGPKAGPSETSHHDLVHDLWERSTDPSEIAAGLPRWVRWEVSDPEGLRAALREGSDRPFATRLRLAGRLLPWNLTVTQADRHLRCEVRGENALFAVWDHRMRLERAIGGRVRLVHEVILTPRHRPRRVAVWLVARAIAAIHQALARELPADEVGRWRVTELSGAMAGHGDDPLGLRS